MAPSDLVSLVGLRSERDLGAGLSNKAIQPQPPRELKSESSRASRALGLASYFVSGCMAINASQVLGAPLYLINKEWYNTWIAFTKQSWGLLTMTMTQWWAPTIVRVSGDSTMRGQLVQTTDGQLLCNFPERMVLIANHQIYTDWLYLWWIGYSAGMHGRIYVVLKESLKNIPVIGWGMQFAQFIFLKRKWEEDKPHLAQHMQRFKNKNPMWLMMFPEGTNLADCTRETSRKWATKNGIKDMQHMLLPRSTGLHFMLNELKEDVEYLYDCTIAYEGVPRGQYAQDIFTVGASYFGGRPPKSVNMYWRRFRVANIPLDDLKKFDLWLRARWSEKDKFIENWYRTGRFPADTGSTKEFNGRIAADAGYIEAEVKPQRWYEFLQVFAPIGVFALVIYIFYGALPQEMINSIKSIDQKTVIKQLNAIQKGQIKIPETKDIIATAPKHLQNRFDAVRKLAEAKNTTPEMVIAQLQNGDNGSIASDTLKPLEPQKAVVTQKPSSVPGNARLSKLPGNPRPTRLPGNPDPQPDTSVQTAKKQPANTSIARPKPTTAIKKDAIKTSTRQKTASSSSHNKPVAVLKSSKASAKPQIEGQKPIRLPQKAPPSSTSNTHKPNSKAKSSSAPKRVLPQRKAVQNIANEDHVANDELRKVRKKLEVRQGKQLPPRKIKRTLASHS